MHTYENSFNKKNNIKLINYQKKILFLEYKYFFGIIPYIDSNKFDIIKNNFFNYKFVIKILYLNPEFYLDLKYIQIDYFREPNEVAYLEIIWNVKHYEYIEKIKNFKNDIDELIKFANKYHLISLIQYKFIKKSLKIINKIFEYDKSMKKLYGNKQDINTIISNSHIELFFDILEIILIKIYLYQKSNYIIKKNPLNISKNHKYINLIKKIKLNLEKQTKINI
jgi:hypothetical protein